MDPLFSRIEAFLFDFDGTLARLEIDFKALKEEILALAKSFGLNNPLWPDPPYLLELVLALKKQIQSQETLWGEDFYLKAMKFIENREWEAASPDNLFPSTRALLEGLRAKGIKLAVLTRNSGKSVYRVFPDLDRYVEIFLPREKVLKPKPDPNHLREAMTSLNVLPQNTIMVGDHPLDILSGKEAGTRTIGVLSGRSQETELLTAGADLVVPHTRSIFDLFNLSSSPH